MMKCLNEKERMVFVLHYWKEMTHDEIAKTIQIPLCTVKTHLMRGKNKLKKLFYCVDYR